MEDLDFEQNNFDLDPIEYKDNLDETSNIRLESFEKTLVIPLDLSIEIIASWYHSKKLIMNPVFQRRYVWNDIMKSVFIESLILNVPIPSILLANNQEENKFIVIDGKQRLNAILSFIAPDNEGIGFKLKGLEILKELNGYTYKKLLEDATKTKYVNRIENALFKANILKNYNTDILFFVFNRLNSGSIPLSTQELRQSLYAGDFVNFINEYSINSQGLRKILHLKEPDKRMRDAELLVRYYSFKYYVDKYNGNINDFFNETCDKLNKSWEIEKEKIINDATEFENAVNFIYENFGEDAFKVFFVKNEKQYFGPFNRPMFDLLTSIFSLEQNRRYISKNAINLKEFTINLFKTNSKFSNAFLPTTHSTEKTKARLEEFTKSLFIKE